MRNCQLGCFSLALLLFSGKKSPFGEEITEVTSYVEPNRIKKLIGVKTKELLLWITLSDIYVDDPPTGRITFQVPAGLSRSFPVSAFQVEEPPPPAPVMEEVKGGAAPAHLQGSSPAASASVAAAQQVKEV